MDLTIRDWMVIVGVLLILAVLLDAWRRVRAERYPRVKVKLAAGSEDAASARDAARDADLAWLKELPNGGARVVQRDDLLRATRADAQQRAAAQDASADEPPQPEPDQHDTRPAAAADKAEQQVPADDEDVELVTGMSGADLPDEPQTMDWLDGVGAGDGPAAPPAPPGPGRLPRAINPEVFMLNVVARSPQGFRGEDILHILLACDLRFGDMSFFHRHEFAAGRGAIQFSVANMMQPGVFDIDHMSDFTTPGLVFFLTLPGPEDMMKAFDYMLETARAVARNLGGDVLDESRSVLTRQTLDHCRQQIRDLERRLLAQAR
ncbi:MAG: cell division protein ZipA [Halioglobus sp.]|nr:cell division protein ZipA [Halioglobus sp.]